MMLADLRARVIKIEEPGCGDEARQWGPPFAYGESAYFPSLNFVMWTLPRVIPTSSEFGFRNSRYRIHVTRIIE